MNAVFHSSPSKIRTRLYALHRSTFDKIQAPLSSSKGGRDQKKCTREFDGVIIEGPVIDAGLQASVFLAHKEEARGCRRGGRVDESLLESLLDVVLHCLALWDGQRVHSTLGECGSRQQVNSTVPWPESGCLFA